MTTFHYFIIISALVTFPVFLHYTRKITDVGLVELFSMAVASALPVFNITLALALLFQGKVIIPKYGDTIQ